MSNQSTNDYNVHEVIFKISLNLVEQKNPRELWIFGKKKQFKVYETTTFSIHLNHHNERVERCCHYVKIISECKPISLTHTCETSITTIVNRNKQKSFSETKHADKLVYKTKMFKFTHTSLILRNYMFE